MSLRDRAAKATDILREAQADPERRVRLRHQAQRYGLLDKLRSIRESKGLTQTQVGELMGVGQSSVSALEGAEIDPRLSTIQRYATAVDHVLVFDLVPVGLRERPTIGQS